MNNNSVQSSGDATKINPQDHGWGERSAIDYTLAMSVDPVQEDTNTTAKYEYNGDIGDIGPAAPELEATLFNTKFRVKAGEQIQHLMDFDVIVEGTEMVKRVEKVSHISHKFFFFCFN
jgi:ATP-dependent RNA helicase DDX3X